MFLQLEQPLHGVDRHVDHRAAGNIVDDDRNADGVVDRLVVLVEPFLRRLVVIGRDDQHRVGARLLGVLRQFDRLGGRIRAGAGDHRHPALGLIDAPFHHLLVLVMRQRRALAGGADRHQAVGALADLPVHQVAECLLVERAVFERRDQRGKRSSKARLGGHGAVLGVPWRDFSTGGLQSIDIGSSGGDESPPIDGFMNWRDTLGPAPLSPSWEPRPIRLTISGYPFGNEIGLMGGRAP